MTPATSAILPLTIGTWYYRVRGFDYNLPAGTQMLSWSDTEQLALAPPTFKVTAEPRSSKRSFKVVKSSPRARTTMVIKVRPAGTTGAVEYESPPTGRSKGDRVVLSDQLINVNAQFGQPADSLVGSDRLNLAFTSAEAAVVQGRAILPGGTISLSGRFNLAQTTISLTVTGGTGAFARARGTFAQTQGNSPIDTYTLALPAANAVRRHTPAIVGAWTPTFAMHSSSRMRLTR